jgi:hypothetical protein
MFTKPPTDFNLLPAPFSLLSIPIAGTRLWGTSLSTFLFHAFDFKNLLKFKIRYKKQLKTEL